MANQSKGGIIVYDDATKRSWEFACDVGISDDVALIFTSRIPEETSLDPENPDAKKSSYQMLCHVLTKIANLKGLMNLEKLTAEYEEKYPGKKSLVGFQKFAVLSTLSEIKFPKEIKKDLLADYEYASLFNWLSSTK